jgi:hypothetical protein
LHTLALALSESSRKGLKINNMTSLPVQGILVLQMHSQEAVGVRVGLGFRSRRNDNGHQ